MVFADDKLNVSEMMEFVHQNIKVPIVANCKGVYLQNTSKTHSYHLKIW